MDRRLQERARVEPHQAAVTALARCEQHDPRRTSRMRVACVGVLVAEIDRQFAADDGLDAVPRHLVGKFQRPEHIVGVSQRQSRLAVRFGKLAELRDLDRPLQQRIGRMNVEMNESGAGHSREKAFGIRGGRDRQARSDSPRNGDTSSGRSPRGTRHCHAFSPGPPGEALRTAE